MSALEVSVVIASYNRSSSLLELLAQLTAQTLPAGAFEVVVVDDGSRTPVRSALVGRSFPFPLALLEQENKGQAIARHEGVLAARAEIIVILDDDMAIGDDFLEAHLSAHREGAEVVLGNIQPAQALAEMPLFERFHANQLAMFRASIRAGGAIEGSALCTGNVSFRRALYLAVDGFDRSLKRSEDRELGIRFQAAGARFAYSDRASSVHASDHSDLEVWLKRAYLYGIYDAKIGHKHADKPKADPWSYVFLVHAVSRPLIAVAVMAPRVSDQLARLAFEVSDKVGRAGMESLALRGATVVFMLEYFRGVRDEAGSAGRCLRDFLGYVQRSRAAA